MVTVTVKNGATGPREFNLYYADQDGNVVDRYIASFGSETIQILKGSMITVNNGGNGMKPSGTGTIDIYPDPSSILNYTYFMIGIYSDATITMA